MPVEITIQPHTPVDVHTGQRTEFDQYQILVGQRVVGYKAKEPGKPPVFVVRDLPDDARAAIAKACAEIDHDPLALGESHAEPVAPE